TLYTVKPNAGGQPASLGPQCAWGTQKLKAALGSPATGGYVSMSVANSSASTDPIAEFIEGFAQRIGQDGNLSGQWESFRTGFAQLGTSTSIGDFLTRSVAELLRGVALLLDGVLAVGNAFLDGFLRLIDSILSLLLEPDTGLLTQPLEIPVL